ncbi:metallopeptidase TldD-related protein [Jiangella alba]|uniref:Predicted Zn-dependent protease or its inactivated homolog n=1 Tax=Jiangella alba TaxID=561176 RepID=A0A1H5MX55_9ACTN|nr:metallopeptidase TldD-related protein [Jiangella alba]SEE93211.1 Predicted Zn-dependent protease or its inactivated homolog [Jiangella alba]
MTPQEIVERCLELSKASGTIVLVDEGSTANLRWATNALTTNGVTRDRSVTVIATVDGGSGTASGVVARSAVTPEGLEPLVRAAEQAARDNGPAEDAQPLVPGDAGPGWADPPGETSPDVFAHIAPALGDAFSRADDERRLLYGYLEHGVRTTYLGSSTGLRARHEQPTGHIGITGKSADKTRSAWVGQSSRDLTDVDVTALDAELTKRLGWAQRTVELPAGRYDTVLPPTAVADLMIYAYWTMSARDAADGQSVYSAPGGATRVGERLSKHPVSLWSDPAAPGLECASSVYAHASSAESSVFDNGLPVGRTSWIDDGTLRALLQTRHSAGLTGLPVTPAIDNLGLTVDGATGGVDDLAAGLERGLLLTCLWYIRAVDPQTLLLTGLTRDGVYLVENGEVTGAVNNYRFNESPVALLDRFTAAGATVPTFSREWGDYFPRTAMPALRVPDFNMSSVSQAS